MQRQQQAWLAGVLGLGLLSVPLARCSWGRLAARTNRSALPAAWAKERSGPPAPRNRFERAIREAERQHMQAWQAVNEARYALEAWDPAAADSLDQAAWVRELVAADRCGKLRRARLLAAQAAALASTPAERYRAALLLAMLACEAGDHRAELRETQALAQLAPHSWITRLWRRHAAGHGNELAGTLRVTLPGNHTPSHSTPFFFCVRCTLIVGQHLEASTQATHRPSSQD